jgi:hypothetical protein
VSATSKEAADDSILALSAQDRRRVATTLVERARAELSGAAAYATMTHELIWLGADPKVLELVARASAQELSHAALWIQLAGRYLGREVGWPQQPRRDIPKHAEAPAQLVPTLHVVGMCCINETLSLPRLEAALAATRSPAMRAALLEVLRDEVDHARIGWAHLASRRVTNADRAALAPWIPRLLLANLRAILGEEEPRLEQPGHGFLSRAQTRDILVDAVHALVLPGFEHVGIDVAPARRGLASGW